MQLPREIIVIVLIVLFLITLVLIIFFDFYNPVEYYRNFEKAKNFHGVVQNKIIDSKNRGRKYLVLQSLTDTTHFTISESDYTNIWNQSDLKDTIAKNKDCDSILLIKSKNQAKIYFPFNYNQSGIVIVRWDKESN